MKKALSFMAALLLMLVASNVAAVEFGVKVGLAVADQDFDYRDFEENFDSRKGLQFGVFAGLPLGPSLVLSPEIHYVPVGVSADYAITDEGGGLIGSGTMTSRIDYISVPVFLKLKLPVGALTPYVMAGPRANLQIGKKDDGFVLVTDELDKVSFGLTVGGGVALEILAGHQLMLEAWFSPDLTKVYDTDLLKVKNQTISVLAGFTL